MNRALEAQEGEKRGGGAAGKLPVFGLLKRVGKVYAPMVKNTKSGSLLPIIKEPISFILLCIQIIAEAIALLTSAVCALRASATTGISASIIKPVLLLAAITINGIGDFWRQAKPVLRKYNGIPKESFPLFFKKCEPRFNGGDPAQQLKILRKWTGI